MISALRRHAGRGMIAPRQARASLDVWLRLALTRHPAASLFDRVWDLRENIWAYDANYVALAEALGAHLLTAAARLSRAPGVRCPITVLPS